MYFMLKNTTNSTLYYDYYFGLSTLAEVLVYLQCYFNFMCLTVYTMLTNSAALGTTIFSNIAMFVVIIYLHIRQFLCMVLYVDLIYQCLATVFENDEYITSKLTKSMPKLWRINQRATVLLKTMSTHYKAKSKELIKAILQKTHPRNKV